MVSSSLLFTGAGTRCRKPVATPSVAGSAPTQVVHLLLIRKPLASSELDAVGAKGEVVPVRVLLQVGEDFLVPLKDDEPPSRLRLTAPGAVLGAVDLDVGHLQGPLKLRVADEEGSREPVGVEGAEVVLDDAGEVWGPYHRFFRVGICLLYTSDAADE